MRGILSYQLVDPQLPNSEEGWFIESENGAYKVADLSIKKIVSGRYAVSEGSEVVLNSSPIARSVTKPKFNTPWWLNFI